jgi:hypothetical protein
VEKTRRRRSFCQNFSWNFTSPKELDRIFRGEILKIERRNLEDLSPKFAVKFGTIYKSLKFSGLRDERKNSPFCHYFLPTERAEKRQKRRTKKEGSERPWGMVTNSGRARLNKGAPSHSEPPTHPPKGGKTRELRQLLRTGGGFHKKRTPI